MRMRTINKVLVLSMAVSGIVALSVAQTAHKPAFEVVSIKAITSSNPFGTRPISIAGGRFVANDNTLSTLTYWAYRSSDGKPLLRSQIVGLPAWAEADRFDVQAKPEGESRDVPLEEMQSMVRGMLEDRFQLKMHRETREEPIYILTVSKPGKIKLSADQSPPPPSSTGPSDPSKPPARGTIAGRMALAGGNAVWTMAGTAVPIANLVNMLRTQVGRAVVDKTALNGLFDFNVKFTPQGVLSTAPVAGPGGGPPPAADPQAPSLFTVLQDELGLKLESARGPVEVLVIESVSRPTEN
jgi:uncharacterized protein (TIGR03435 family)